MARKPKKSRKKGLGCLKILVILILLAVMVGLAGTSVYVLASIKDMPSFDPDKLRESSATSFIYDARGELLTKLHGEENRVPVKLSDIPQELQDAVVAVEDARFYEHPGVDVRAIARAAWRIATKQSFEGGSTITQQLVKTSFLLPRPPCGGKFKRLFCPCRWSGSIPRTKSWRCISMRSTSAMGPMASRPRPNSILARMSGTSTWPSLPCWRE